MKDVHVRVEHLCRDFGSEHILKDVCCDFEEGLIHGIVGQNGSGKTVLFKCICGFVLPTSGRVLVDWEEVGKDVDFPPDLGLIIETPGFLPGLTGQRNLEILASLRGKIGKKEVRQAIARTGLDPDLKKHVSKYSLGMRQRLGIAQAIMEGPSLLVLDEPFNGLDREGTRSMRDLLREMNEAGTTILLASHNPADIDELCTAVYEMDAGVLEKVR